MIGIRKILLTSQELFVAADGEGVFLRIDGALLGREHSPPHRGTLASQTEDSS
jgi:hypothetical protein